MAYMIFLINRIVNAGEAQDIEVGDDVVIQGDIQPAFWAGLITAVMATTQRVRSDPE